MVNDGTETTQWKMREMVNDDTETRWWRMREIVNDGTKKNTVEDEGNIE